MDDARTSRRQFLQAAGLAVAAPYLVPASALGAAGRPPASERIVMGTIGTGGQGTGDMHGFMDFPEVQMVAVCDPAADHRKGASQGSRYQRPCDLPHRGGHGIPQHFQGFSEWQLAKSAIVGTLKSCSLGSSATLSLSPCAVGT